MKIPAKSHLPEAIEKYFWAKVEKTDSCWLWKGCLLNHSYGSIWMDGKHYQTHRFSWLLHKGVIPQGQCVLHKCDVPLCVNPDHLFLGTQQENVADMRAKNRNPKVAPEKTHTAKLTWEDVRTIRTVYQPRKVTMAFLASKYGVDTSTIACILKNTTWKE